MKIEKCEIIVNCEMRTVKFLDDFNTFNPVFQLLLVLGVLKLLRPRL